MPRIAGNKQNKGKAFIEFASKESARKASIYSLSKVD